MDLKLATKIEIAVSHLLQVHYINDFCVLEYQGFIGGGAIGPLGSELQK